MLNQWILDANSLEKRKRVNLTLTHHMYCVGVWWCKQYKGGKSLCNSVTPNSPSPYPNKSCLFTPYTLIKPVSVDERIWIDYPSDPIFLVECTIGTMQYSTISIIIFDIFYTPLYSSCSFDSSRLHWKQTDNWSRFNNRLYLAINIVSIIVQMSWYFRFFH